MIEWTDLWRLMIEVNASVGSRDEWLADRGVCECVVTSLADVFHRIVAMDILGATTDNDIDQSVAGVLSDGFLLGWSTSEMFGGDRLVHWPDVLHVAQVQSARRKSRTEVCEERGMTGEALDSLVELGIAQLRTATNETGRFREHLDAATIDTFLAGWDAYTQYGGEQVAT